MKTTPEKRVQNQIINYLKSLPGCYVERRSSYGFSYKKGIPDIFFVYKGRHVECEIKKQDGTTSTMQDYYKTYFTSIGVLYVEAHSLADLQDFINKNFYYDKK